ncbi:MAG: hypothetical protein JNK50_11545 [Bacteroidia bacterium]|nr:hypothetical protein [Bacteroidia bacterium]
MTKSAFIAFSLFSATICYSQTTDHSVKELSKKNATTGSQEKVKPSLVEEYTGTKPNPIHPDTMKVYLYNPSNETTDKKASSDDKKNSKPH